jgi:TonB family protein
MGGSGSPGSKTAAHDGGPGNGNRPGSSDLPSGLEVRPVDPITNPSRDHQDRAANVIADAKPPLWPSSARAAKTIMTEPTAEEREVFGARKFYSMTLNMPNLNSAGGSWVIRFAELNDNAEKGELIAPEATRKVDPAYPLELMRSQVQGKVTLYALIRRDGTVAGVRVLNSVDDRLDEYARAALSNWHFHPATRSGNPVDLEAVVTIPFRTRAGF